jgi:hypothetical protein
LWLDDEHAPCHGALSRLEAHPFANQPASRDADCLSGHLLLACLARILNSEVAL